MEHGTNATMAIQCVLHAIGMTLITPATMADGRHASFAATCWNGVIARHSRVASEIT